MICSSTFSQAFVGSAQPAGVAGEDDVVTFLVNVAEGESGVVEVRLRQLVLPDDPRGGERAGGREGHVIAEVGELRLGDVQSLGDLRG